MASDAYIQSAKLANRQPTTYMSVESAEGDTLYYTTQGQWEGSDTLTNTDTTEEPGSVTNLQFDQSAVATFVGDHGGDEANFLVFAQKYTATYDHYLNEIIHPLLWSIGLEGTTIRARIQITDTDPFSTTPSITHTGAEFAVSAAQALGGGGWGFYNGTLSATSVDHKVLNGETWWVSVEYFRESPVQVNEWRLCMSMLGDGSDLSNPFNIPLYSTLNFLTEAIKPTSQLITSAIDFGAVTLSNPIFSVDDITEAGALINYSYTYSTDDITYLSGGTIVDGSSLTASRYFKIQADFSTSTGGRGKLREIQLKEGIFRYFGSHIDTPFAGVSPQIIPNSVSTLSQKIQIGKGLSTTGESSVRMFWVPEVSDMIASGYLKGKDVAIYSGFVGLPTDAYEPILVGTWYDHDLDEINRVITVKIRDAFKQFEKRKIPEEVVSTTTGAITTPPLTFTTTSLVTVMKQIFDEIGLRDRYISPDFDTLEAGDYAAAKYNVSRSLVKFSTPSVGNPTDFNKLLDELAVTGSMYLVPQGNGQIKPKPFDPNQEHTETLDANEIDFVNLKGNISEFFSRFYAYYNPKTTLTADPSDDTDDYDNGTAVIDVTAELNWFPERGTKQHFDKWKVGRTVAGTPLTTPPQALTDLMDLWNSLFTEPLYTVSAKKIPPRFANIEPADVIAVDNLELPVVDNPWLFGAIYNGKALSVSGEITTLLGTTMSDDGLNIYAVDFANATIYQYTMSTANDVSTAVYSGKSFATTAQTTAPYNARFSTDGLTMFVIKTDTVFQYTLSVAWDVSTSVYAVKFKSLATESSSFRNMVFNADGTKMYAVTLGTGASVYQYSMSTAWDVSTLSYDSKSIDVSSEELNPSGVYLTNDGFRMFIIGSAHETVFQYDVGLIEDISTAVYSGNNYVVTETASAVGLAFSSDGLQMYVSGQAEKKVFQYDLSTVFEVADPEYTEGERVIHDGFMWRARQDGAGKDPTSEAAYWQNTLISDAGLTVGKHFFVLGRKFNPNQATMELDLMEMPPGTLGAFSADEFSSDFDIG